MHPSSFSPTFQDMAQPLIEDVSPMMALVFSAYARQAKTGCKNPEDPQVVFGFPCGVPPWIAEEDFGSPNYFFLLACAKGIDPFSS